MIFLINGHTGTIFLADQLHSKIILVSPKFKAKLNQLGYTNELVFPNLKSINLARKLFTSNDFSHLTDSELHTLLTQTYQEYFI